jgi:uncharacterized protein
LTHPQLQEIIAQLRQHFEWLYDKRLVSIILFGSQARKEARADSDIDVLIVLRGAVDVPGERKRVSEFLARLCLDYEVLITCLWMEEQAWKTRQSPLLLNVRREGIAVKLGWQAGFFEEVIGGWQGESLVRDVQPAYELRQNLK